MFIWIEYGLVMDYFYEEFDCTQTCEFQEIIAWEEEVKIKVTPIFYFLEDN